MNVDTPIHGRLAQFQYLGGQSVTGLQTRDQLFSSVIRFFGLDAIHHLDKYFRFDFDNCGDDVLLAGGWPLGVFR